MNKKVMVSAVVGFGLLVAAYSTGRYYIAQNIDSTLAKIEKAHEGMDLAYDDFSIDPMGAQLTLHDVRIKFTKEYWDKIKPSTTSPQVRNLSPDDQKALDKQNQKIDELVLGVTLVVKDLHYRKCDFDHVVPRFCDSTLDGISFVSGSADVEKIKNKVEAFLGGPLDLSVSTKMDYNEKSKLSTSKTVLTVNDDFAVFTMNHKIELDFNKIDKLVTELRDQSSSDPKAMQQLMLKNLGTFSDTKIGGFGVTVSGAKFWEYALAFLCESKVDPEFLNTIDSIDDLERSPYMDAQKREEVLAPEFEQMALRRPSFQKAADAAKAFVKDPESLEFQYALKEPKGLMSIFLENAAMPMDSASGLSLAKRGVSVKINGTKLDL